MPRARLNKANERGSHDGVLHQVREESVSLAKRWENLNMELDKLQVHKVQLNDEWHTLECERERAVREREDFERSVSAEWFQEYTHDDDDKDSDRIVALNVGGQRFDVSVGVLRSDRFSLLAATCVPTGQRIIKAEADGTFFFDRDWWLFRLILAFLRDKQLPGDQLLLRDLYREAGFYCLCAMQREIEMKLADIKLGLDKNRNNNNNNSSNNNSEKGMSATRLSAQHSFDYESLVRDSSSRLDAYQRECSKSKSLAVGRLPDPFGFTRT